MILKYMYKIKIKKKTHTYIKLIFFYIQYEVSQSPLFRYDIFVVLIGLWN